jgi:SAM-dependent methyltransferase
VPAAGVENSFEYNHSMQINGKRNHTVESTPVMEKSSRLKEIIRIHLLEKTARKLIPKDKSVLDFGCGYGFYFKINPLAHGIDGDPNSVDYLNSKYGYEKVKLGNLVETLPFENSTFSWVLAHDVFEHFTFDELVLIMNELYRILESKGKLVVWVPNMKGYIHGMHSGHKLFVDHSIVLELCELTGFQVLKSYPEPFSKIFRAGFTHNKEVFVIGKL